jgi:uncharacterized protein
MNDVSRNHANVSAEPQPETPPKNRAHRPGFNNRVKAALEAGVVFIGVTIAAVVFSQLKNSPALSEFSYLLTSGLFLVIALMAAERDPRGISHYGLDFSGLLSPSESPPNGWFDSLKDLVGALVKSAPVGVRESLIAIAMGTVIFPLFTVGFYFWHTPTRGFTFSLPNDLAWRFVSQMIVVGLPEEALFRGYLYTRLIDASTGEMRVLGVRIFPLALVTQAVLFALIHFAIDFQMTRLAVFFPALLFGWLRSWRRGLGATIVFHAFCNIYSDILVRAWL